MKTAHGDNAANDPQAKSRSHQQDPDNSSPGVDEPEAHLAGGEGGGHQKHRGKKCCRYVKRFFRGSKATDFITLVFTCLLVLIAWRQSTISETANAISQEAARASEASVKIADEALRRQVAGEETIEKMLKATQDATLATKRIAGQTAQVVVAAKKANDRAKEANQLAAQGVRVAEANAAHAGVVAAATQQAATLDADIAMKTLRAYVSVLGGEFTFAEGEAMATVTLKNTGRTFAHNMQATGAFVCVQRGTPIRVGAVVLSPPPSIGPEGVFKVVREQPWAGIAPEAMDCYIEGSVHYDDVYGWHHVTNFRFLLGEKLGEGRYSMVYDREGNNAN